MTEIDNEGVDRHYDVAVVGAGPIGLALTQLLAQKGVRVALIDPFRVVCQHPRASHLDDETMRILQTIGASGLEPACLRQSGWRLLRPDGSTHLTMSVPNGETDQGWNADYQFHQPDFESLMRGKLASIPNVDLWLGWKLTNMGETRGAVELSLGSTKSGKTAAIQASWTVGCDGAASFVRDWLGADIEDLQGTQRSLIIDIEPFSHPETLPRTSGFVSFRPELPATYCPARAPMLRFEFLLNDTHDTDDLERPETVYRLLSEWIDPGQYRIMRSDVYRWHAWLTKGWRKGRVLLAGDAAHLMPPLLGQGMCSGLRDAMNLAWKLALVVKGESPERLLDTYETERAPHVRPFIAESARHGNMMETFTFPEAPPDGRPVVVERFRPSLGPGLVAQPSGAVSQLAPQPRSADATRLDDRTGYNFTVIGAQDIIAAVGSDTAAIWKKLNVVQVTEIGGAVSDWLSTNRAQAAVVRPDRYTFAFCQSARDLDHATHALAEQVFKEAVPA